MFLSKKNIHTQSYLCLQAFLWKRKTKQICIHTYRVYFESVANWKSALNRTGKRAQEKADTGRLSRIHNSLMTRLWAREQLIKFTIYNTTRTTCICKTVSYDASPPRTPSNHIHPPLLFLAQCTTKLHNIIGTI